MADAAALAPIGRGRGGGAMRGSSRPLALVFALALLGAEWSGSLSAQEAGPRSRDCTLVMVPTDSTRQLSREVGEDLYVTYIWGGMQWTCGGARMVADSAVQFDEDDRVKMMGDVDYQDSIRVLQSDTLIYFEREDRIVAETRVHVVRLASGSTLSGPRVEFLRGGRGGPERTVATGRPHMALPGMAGDTAAPVEVDADRIILRGESEADAWGEVVIERPDLTATADSAFFQMGEERGELFGSPVVEGRGIRLSGERIRTEFSEGELEEMESVTGATASGESFELFAERILVKLVEGELDRLWAHGDGRSVAISRPYRLSADSLAFEFTAGEIDSMTAVTDARAVEIGDETLEDPLREIELTVSPERSWVTGDTVWLTFRPADAPAPATRAGEEPGVGLAGPEDVESEDPAAEDDSEPARAIERMRAVGNARSFYVVRDEDAAEDSPARNYQIGARIVVHFRDGEASRVEAENAIGIYLDPDAAGPASGSGGTGQDRSAPDGPPGTEPAEPDPAPGDTMPGDPMPGERVPADTVPADTAVADTLPPDSTSAGPLPPEAAPADTVPGGRLSRAGPRSVTARPAAVPRTARGPR